MPRMRRCWRPTLEEFPATLMRSTWVSAVSSFGVCAVRCLSHAFFRISHESGDLCIDLGPAAFRDPPSEFRSTPPRRGDGSALLPSLMPRCFDPRPREGATTAKSADLRGKAFRSTPPRRGDRAHTALHPVDQRFDPRPREGASPPACCPISRRCFDPRPREGATRSPPPVPSASRSFDPRPREGATFAARSHR